MRGYFRQHSKAGHRVTRPAMRREPDLTSIQKFYADGGYVAAPKKYAGGGEVAIKFIKNLLREAPNAAQQGLQRIRDWTRVNNNEAMAYGFPDQLGHGFIKGQTRSVAPDQKWHDFVSGYPDKIHWNAHSHPWGALPTPSKGDLNFWSLPSGMDDLMGPMDMWITGVTNPNELLRLSPLPLTERGVDTANNMKRIADFAYGRPRGRFSRSKEVMEQFDPEIINSLKSDQNILGDPLLNKLEAGWYINDLSRQHPIYVDADMPLNEAGIKASDAWPELIKYYNKVGYAPYAQGGSVDDKVSKASVNYSPGMGRTRCRNCMHYDNGSCEIVRGDIDPSYWCEEFERRYAKGGSVADDLNLYQSQYYAGGGKVDDDFLAYNSQYYAGGGAVSHLRNWLRVLAEGLELPIGVRAPSEVLPKIIEDGRFKSQFETGSSGGAYDPDFRRNIEEGLFKIPPDLPDAQRPVYGSLFDPADRGSFWSARSYGNVVGVPKSEVKDRTTFTLGDSFGASRSYPFVDQSRIRLSPKAENVQSLWEQMIHGGTGRRGAKPTDWSPKDFAQFWNLSPVKPYGYIEAQIHGGLPISDLSRWVWEPRWKYDPMGNLYEGAPRIADQTGIPVIGRTEENRPWHLFSPGASKHETIGDVLRKEDLGYAMGGGVDPMAGQSGIGAYDDTVDGQVPGYAGGGIIKWLQRMAEPIRAWHGSPHAFDKFDASHIGTGEGNQTFGHGLYFAENPGVAKYYRDALSTPPQDAVNTILNWAKTDDSFLAKIRHHPERLPKEMKSLSGLTKYYDNEEVLTNIRRLLEDTPGIKESAWTSMQPFHNLDRIFGQTPSGHLYEVNLHADPESFLNLDLPLWKQPLGQRAYDALSPTIDYSLRGVHHSSLPIGKFDALIQRPETAAALRDVEIPGIRYLDQGSRRAGEGSHNYVVFPGAEDIVEIVNRYYLGGSVGDEE